MYNSLMLQSRSSWFASSGDAELIKKIQCIYEIIITLSNNKAFTEDIAGGGVGWGLLSPNGEVLGWKKIVLAII